MPIMGIHAKPANSSLNHLGAMFVMVMASGVSVSIAGEYMPQSYQTQVDTSLRKISFNNNGLQNILRISGYPAAMSKAFSELISNAAKANQFVFVGDTSHRKGAVLQTFAQADNFAALKRQGVKHLFLEVPRDMQASLDSMLAGRTTQDQFVADLNKRHPRALDSDIGDKGFGQELAKVALLAKANGMKVHCADHRQAEIAKLRGKPYEHYVHNGHPDASFEDFLKDITARKMPDGSRTNIYTNDRPLAEFIASKAGKEKAVIFYGSGHGDTSYGIDEILGEKRTARVDIHESKPWGITEWWNRREMKSQMNMTADPDKPFGRFYIDKGEVERFEQKPVTEMTPGEIDFDKLKSAASGLDNASGKPEARPTAPKQRPGSTPRAP